MRMICLLYTSREDEGGTYGVSSGGSISENPEGETIFQIFYQTDPEKVDKLNKIIYAELDKVAKNGPDQEMFNKTILNMKKDYAETVSYTHLKADEYVEVTPKSMRLRKILLNELDRKRANKA